MLKTKILGIFLSLSVGSVYAQLTYIPDDAFEAYLENEFQLIGMSNGISNDNYVNSAAVEICVGLDISSQYPVQSLSGIENFTALKSIFLSGILISNLDISALTSNPFAVKIANCPLLSAVSLPSSDSWSLLDFTGNNSLTSIQFGQNSALSGSQLSGVVTVTLNANVQLTSFDISNLPLTSTGVLQITNNAALECVNLKNGFCIMWTGVSIVGNDVLECVQVDNPMYSETSATWTDSSISGTYSTSCSACLVSIEEHEQNAFAVYPNPSDDLITIERSQNQISDSYKILDQQGRIILTGFLQGDKTTINLDLQKGVYYLMIDDSLVQVLK
jgi:hypothetical protein